MGHDARPRASEEVVVLFDGVCRFCSGSVRFILERDSGRRFAFAPLQSPVAQKLLQQHDRLLEQMDSLVLVENGRCSTRSTAALRIVRHLSWPWPLLSVLILVPRPLRDLCYDMFARNRYRWFGMNEECFIPLPDERERFLE